MPTTRFGKYVVLLMIGAVSLFILAQLIIMSGQRGGDTILDNLWISIPMLSAGTAAIASFLLGGISIVRAQERSPFVFVCCLMGFVVLIFVLGEVFFPH